MPRLYSKARAAGLVAFAPLTMQIKASERENVLLVWGHEYVDGRTNSRGQGAREVERARPGGTVRRVLFRNPAGGIGRRNAQHPHEDVCCDQVRARGGRRRVFRRPLFWRCRPGGSNSGNEPEMPRRSKGARLWLRPERAAGGRAERAVWIIRDGGVDKSTGCGASERRRRDDWRRISPPSMPPSGANATSIASRSPT